MTMPVLPSAMNIDVENKKAVIGGIKRVLDAFRAAGLVEGELAYGDLVHEPGLLYDFFQACRARPELLANIAVDEAGAPVTNEDQKLVCGTTLSQIQYLLVKTCAKYHLELGSSKPTETVSRTVTTRSFLGFKKTSQVDHKVGGEIDRNRVRILLPMIYFDWQLPLLPDYTLLTLGQISELGNNLLVLRTPESLREVAQFDHQLIRKAKTVLESDFPFMLEICPAALKGVAYWGRDWFRFFHAVIGSNVFEFFTREDQYYMVCASVSKPALRLFGDMLCYIASANLEELARLDLDKLEMVLVGMRNAFGDRIRAVLSQREMVADMMHKMVESLRVIEYKQDKLSMAVELTCKAMAPKILTWLDEQTAVA